MRFGLWLEPEMVKPDSDLYRTHPDWVLHMPHRRRTALLGRGLPLDLPAGDHASVLVRLQRIDITESKL
jgi:hypothetical protein